MKRTSLALALLLAAPMAALAEQKEGYNIFGWQSYAWEFVDVEVPGGKPQGENRKFNRIASTASSISFAASVDTGYHGVMANFQCGQWTFLNQHTGRGLCTAESKVGFSHADLGDLAFATWLLPFFELRIWMDPFYGVGDDGHSSIMGSVGAQTVFYSPGGFDVSSIGSARSTDLNGAGLDLSAYGIDASFNRRQESIVQYMSPNWSGFMLRFAFTPGLRNDTTTLNDHRADPMIMSGQLTYGNGPLWLGLGWQNHDDWTVQSISCGSQGGGGNADVLGSGGPLVAVLPPTDSGQGDLACMRESNADAYRLAARYTFDMGNGASAQIGVMWEDLEYELMGNTDIRTSLWRFGYGTSALNLPTAASTYMPGETLGGGDLTFGREAFQVTGKIKFGGPLDFRFSYMDADDLEMECAMCSGDWQNTAADSISLGLVYTLPAGTEMRMTYTEVDNEDNGTYQLGISGAGIFAPPGRDIEMFAIGFAQGFD